MVASLLLVLAVDPNKVLRFDTSKVYLMPLLGPPRNKELVAVPAPRLPWHINRVNLRFIHIEYFTHQPTDRILVVFLLKIKPCFFIKSENFHKIVVDVWVVEIFLLSFHDVFKSFVISKKSITIL